MTKTTFLGLAVAACSLSACSGAVGPADGSEVGTALDADAHDASPIGERLDGRSHTGTDASEVVAAPPDGAPHDGAPHERSPADVAADAREAGDVGPGVTCPALQITGDPRAEQGARFTYRAIDDGVEYDLQGIVSSPDGQGPFPAVVVSHGHGGQPTGYSLRIGKVMTSWGAVVIGVQYTHAPGDTGKPAGDIGATSANVSRAHKAYQLLSCLGYVDMRRVAAHGHSMGGFVTGELVGTYPDDFLVASHTAGGVSQLHGTKAATAARIVAPYQLHHGDVDTVVRLRLSEDLADILRAAGTPHELHVYPAYDHDDIPFDATMLERVQRWYRDHGLL